MLASRIVTDQNAPTGRTHEEQEQIDKAIGEADKASRIDRPYMVNALAFELYWPIFVSFSRAATGTFSWVTRRPSSTPRPSAALRQVCLRPNRKRPCEIWPYACANADIDHRLTEPKHPWTNGQVERMNRTLKAATVKRFHYETHDQLRSHLTDFVTAYSFAKRLKTLKGLTPYEYICRLWTRSPADSP